MTATATTLVILAGLLGLSAATADEPAAGCERATAYSASAKLVRFGEMTYVTYLDVDFKVRVMALNHRTGKWDGPVAVGQAVDNHGGPALAVTPDGTLHLAFGSHCSPMQYVHSLAPGDIHHWNQPEQLGVSTTYPSLVAGADGTLYLVYRGHDQTDQAGTLEWQLTFQRRDPAGHWSRGMLLADLPSGAASPRANYHHRLLLDRQGRLHLAWTNILVAPGRVYYLWSGDGGNTWSARPGGAVLALPVSNAAPPPVCVSEGADVMLSLAVDPEGTPHLLYGPNYGANPIQHLVPGPGEAWRQLPGFTLPGKAVWLHQALFDRQGRLHAALFTDKPGSWISDSAVAQEAVWAPGQPWRVRPIANLTAYDRGCYMPALTESGGKIECLFYSGHGLDTATATVGVHGHVGTDVYYADLTQGWAQRIAPHPTARHTMDAAWQDMQ